MTSEHIIYTFKVILQPQKRKSIKKILINDNLITLIKARRKQLTEILENLTLQKKTEPQGKLKIVKKPYFVQFYHRKTAADIQGTYINKKNLQIAKKLAQKDYNLATEQTLQKDLNALDVFLANYSEQEMINNYKSRIPQVQSLISPIAITPEDYAKNWQTVPYNGLPFENDTTEFYTLRGERVRSKSEIMIANALFQAKIPYRYEFPVSIKNSKTFHPDFLCLNPHNGCEIIWEHFGLMDKESYSQNALSKISIYADNGWILGKNFLYTMETTAVPLSTRFIEKLIKTHFA